MLALGESSHNATGFTSKKIFHFLYNSINRGRSHLHPRAAGWASLGTRSCLRKQAENTHFQELCQHKYSHHEAPTCPLSCGSFCLIGKPRLTREKKLWENSTKQRAKLWSDILCLWNWEKEGCILGTNPKRKGLLGLSWSQYRKFLDRSMTSVLGPRFSPQQIPQRWSCSWKHHRLHTQTQDSTLGKLSPNLESLTGPPQPQPPWQVSLPLTSIWLFLFLSGHRDAEYSRPWPPWKRQGAGRLQSSQEVRSSIHRGGVL